MSLEQVPEVRDWPTGRSRRATVAAQFGADRADLMAWALTTADPLADAVVAEIQERGRAVRVALAAGIEHGLASLEDPPPAVAALLTQAESLPDYVDDALLDEGPLPQFSTPNPVHAISLSAGALVRVYQSPSIATVLATTGRLIDGAPRRLEETGKWVRVAMLPGAMRRGAPGYVQTLQVRMLHAQMRRLARTRGYDEAAFGAPINQVDLTRTWMDFTVTSYRAEGLMGFDLNSSEQHSLYRYWWYIGHVLGIDARLIEGIADNEQAKRVDDLLETVTGPLIPESGVLAKATVEAIADVLQEVLSVPAHLGLRAMYALTRRFHGDVLCDELGLPAAGPADAVLGAAIRVVRARRAKLRQDPEAWRREQLKQVEQVRSLEAEPVEPTGYQQEAAVG